MTTNLKPYREYKDSGVEWLGTVPAHWKILPGRACYREKKVPNTGMKESSVLSLSYGQIVVKPVEKLHGLVPASFETYQIVDPGDIIIRPTDLQNDWNSLRFGLSRHRGIITSAYMCLHTNRAMIREYGYLLLHTYDLKKIFYGLGSGLRQNLDWRDFKYLPCLAPPPPEQSVIVRFIDYFEHQINRLIRAKQKMIGLLNEQKQSIINQYVTGKIDPRTGKPYPRYKSSGVEWLADVPEHWEIRRLKYWAHINRHTLPESTPPYYYFRYIDIGSVETAYLNKEPVAMQFSNAPSRARRLLSTGDTIISTVRTYLKAVYYVADEVNDLVASTGFAVLTPRAEVDPEYLSYVIQGNSFIDRVTAYSTGIAYPAISETRLGTFHLALPSQSIQEQKTIVGTIRKETGIQNSAIQRSRTEIDLLREYRTRLIADVVTGKLDVRGVELPDIEETEGFEDRYASEGTETAEMNHPEEIINGDERHQ